MREFAEPHIGELNSAELFKKDNVLPTKEELVTPEKNNLSRLTGHGSPMSGGSSKGDFNSKKR
jgi:hypothetical protein